jgi:hypothetical protein
MNREPNKNRQSFSPLSRKNRSLLISICVLVAGMVAFFNDILELLCRFESWNWCEAQPQVVEPEKDLSAGQIPAKTDIPKKPDTGESVTTTRTLTKPETDKALAMTTAQLAIKLFAGNNSANLQIILPQTTFKVGDTMQMRFLSNRGGYLIVFDIDSQAALTQLYPNQDSGQPEPLKAGEILTIPDVYYDPNSDDDFQFEAEEPIGNGILVAILIEDELGIGYNILPVPFEKIPSEAAKTLLQLLYKQLGKPVPDENGVEHFISWSSTVAHYEIMH